MMFWHDTNYYYYYGTVQNETVQSEIVQKESTVNINPIELTVRYLLIWYQVKQTRNINQ